KGGGVTLSFAADRLTPSIVFGLDNIYSGRIKVISGEVAKMRINMRDKDKNTLKFIRELLLNIKDLG
ncbi:MAG: hypothetical protein IJH94_06125, partial [Clostridia bacterium]|nr:hypothetical protein [Clostridia bacterium]